LQHRRRGRTKRAGGQEHEAGIADEPANVGDLTGDPRQVEPFGQRAKAIRASAG
jgi:hypothetical protein